MPKRSVGDVDEIWSPLEILQMAKAAYDEPYISQDDRLEHAAFVCLDYVGAFRVNEALDLYASQFKRLLSLEGMHFLVVEQALIEKSGGMRRNVAIDPTDPLAIPVEAHLASLLPQEKVFGMGDSTVLTMIGRISGGTAWTHLLRAMRDRYLAVAFNQQERKKIVGWSQGGRQGGARFREVEDRYAGLNWMWYADRLHRLNESYWSHQVIPADVRAWLQGLSPPK